VGLFSKIIKGAGLKREEIKKGADMAKVNKAAKTDDKKQNGISYGCRFFIRSLLRQRTPYFIF